MSRSPTGHVPRRGVTLVELLAALAILTIVAAISGAAFHAWATPKPPPVDAAAIAAARREALQSGRQVTVVVDDSLRPRSVLALPDGSVIGDSALGVDRLAGRPRDARH